MQRTAGIAHAIATWFGTGHVRWAPGTAATLTAWPLHHVLTVLPPAAELSIVIAVVVVGTWAAEQVSRASGIEDPQFVVIDEVAGALISLALVRGHGLGAEMLALTLFRALDILKPWPLRRFEAIRPAGVGIMADDFGAALVAGLVVRLLV